MAKDTTQVIARATDQVASERIHDADRELNENMLHWLQLFLEGKCTKEQLEKLFNKAYVKEEFVFAPWES